MASVLHRCGRAPTLCKLFLPQRCKAQPFTYAAASRKVREIPSEKYSRVSHAGYWVEVLPAEPLASVGAAESVDAEGSAVRAAGAAGRSSRATSRGACRELSCELIEEPEDVAPAPCAPKVMVIGVLPAELPLGGATTIARPPDGRVTTRERFEALVFDPLLDTFAVDEFEPVVLLLLVPSFALVFELLAVFVLFVLFV